MSKWCKAANNSLNQPPAPTFSPFSSSGKGTGQPRTAAAAVLYQRGGQEPIARAPSPPPPASDLLSLGP
ncbi:hypothetical protein NC652_033430 [Populus alba x Populus x berolinensis]|uniref:Uncharacterized protein n=1 Tax=Populus alba TaxID=43335 RepID=A0ACC4B3F0_POPAL|nr:hypothetical protein NC652_033430 [Populus alba x Populus x berolinensis]